MDIKVLLGKKIKEIRKAKNITQEKLSEAIGIEPASLSNIENGKYYPTADNLEKILKTLDIKPYELFDFENLQCKDILLNEMVAELSQNEKLLKIMYSIFNSLKFLFCGDKKSLYK